MASESNLWLQASSASTKINQIKASYGKIVDAANKISTDLSGVVGKNGKWYDENSAVFANWWNQSSSKDGSITGGKLVVDSKGFLRIKGGSESDGEDKIKFILQLAGKLFYMTVCASMTALYTTNQKSIDGSTRLKAAYKCGSNKTLQDKVAGKSVSGSQLIKMMENSFDSKEWKHVALKVSPLGVSNTNEKELANLAATLKTDLSNLNKVLEAYCKEIAKVAKNRDKSMWWGVSDASNITSAVNATNEQVDKYLTSFRNSVVTALTASSETVSTEIAALKKLKF